MQDADNDVSDSGSDSSDSDGVVSDDDDKVSDDDDEVSDDDDIDRTEIEKGPLDKKWRLEKTFESKDAMNEFLAKENWWSYRSRNPCSEGTKFLYRCNKVMRNSKQQCEAGIYIVHSDNFDADGATTSYLLYRKSALHTHRKSPAYKQRVSERVKKTIIQQFENGRKPKKISYSILSDSSIPMKEKPSYKQVRQIISNFINSGSGSSPLTMRKLTDFVKEHMKKPNGEDEAFIVKFERSPKQQKTDKYFRLFISTIRLLRNAAESTLVHADATHKVTTEKMPLIATGVTDRNNKFHFAGMTLANHEKQADYMVTFDGLKRGVALASKKTFEPKVLVSDGDAAIHNAYFSVFGVDDGTYYTTQ